MVKKMRLSTVVAFYVLFDGVHCIDNDPEKLLVTLQNKFWESCMKRLPIHSTRFGLYKYNDRVENASITVLDDIKDEAQNMLRDLQRIPLNSLSLKHSDDYSVLHEILTTLVKSYRWAQYGPLNPINFLEGIQRDLHRLPENTPFDTIGDYENYLARLQKLPRYLKQLQDRLEEAVRRKHTYHAVSMNAVPAQFDKSFTNKSQDLSFYKPFMETLDSNSDIPDETNNRLKHAGDLAVRNIQHSLKQLKNYIVQDYMKNTRPSIGINSIENGEELYRDSVKFHTSLNISPEEIHNIGLKEVQRIQAKMKTIMNRQGYTGSVKEYFDSLKRRPSLHYNTSEELLSAFRSIVADRIEPKMKLMFRQFPNIPLEIRASPSDGPRGYFVQGSRDGPKPGIFYLNTFRPKSMLMVDFMALSLHETYPGHHYQFSISSSADIPLYRRRYISRMHNVPFDILSFSAFVEGWGLYAERLGEEMGLFKDDYEMMGRYSSEIFRACRLVVDTGIHHYNWTRQQAIDYMLNYTAFSEKQISIEVDRYSTWPGQAVSYKIGEIKIVELRDKAEKELGSLFDIKEFHATVLKNGKIPLKLLEGIVTRWIKDVKSSKKEALGCSNDGTTAYSSRGKLGILGLCTCVFMKTLYQPRQGVFSWF